MAQNTHIQSLRRAFKRTFLQDVSATVTFADTDLLNHIEALKAFLGDRFRISDNVNMPKLSAIDVVSENRDEKFHFATNSASVTINANLYHFYEDSLEPRINDIISYLKVLGISDVNTFTIQKRNIFPGTSSNAFDVWRKAINETFKEENILKLVSTPNIQHKPFKMSIEGVAVTEWGELRVPFLIDVPDKDNFRFQLDLVATSKPVSIKDLITMGTRMNNCIFKEFTKIISDKLLDLLQKEE